MIIDGATAERHINEKAEVVVIGSGAGGAAVATELAERGHSVVLVEEGGYYTGRSFTGRPREMIDLLYRNRGLTGTIGAVPIPIPLGRCVGGTTVINSGTCYRAPPEVLEQWHSGHGVEGVREAELHPFYQQAEQGLGVRIVPDGAYGRNSRLFERGARALGYAGGRIPRAERGCLGTGVCVLGCPQDAKQGMHVSYIPRAIRAGCRLYTRCRADRVLIASGRAYGMIGFFLSADDRETSIQLRVLAEKVVVSAGALLTPVLFRRSGLGCRWIGRNLHIHPAVRVIALYPDEVRGWEEVPQAYNVHQFLPEGIFIQGMFVPPGLEAPVLPGIGSRHKEIMAHYGRLGSFGALISDVSTGRVRVSPGGAPLVSYRLLPEDVRKLTRAVSLTAEIFFAAGASKVYTGIYPRPVLHSIAEARGLVGIGLRPRDFRLMAFHPQGTCRMGSDRRLSVVDSQGETHEVRDLFAADASLFPCSCRVNPQLTIMALASKIAAGIHDSLGR